MKRTIIRFVLVGLALALAPIKSGAQPTPNPPGQISYQGFLTDANGLPLATNTPVNYNVQFRIFDASTVGHLLWGEQQVVTVDRGYFTVMLGNGSALSGNPDLPSVFSGNTASDRYLEMTVLGLAPGDPAIAPRLRLLASPYSFLASKALSVDGAAVQTGTIADERLSANVALKVGGNNFVGPQNINGSVGIGTISPGKALQVGDQAVFGSEGMIRLASRTSTGGGASRTWDIGVPQTGNNASGVGYSFVINDGPTTDFMVKYGTGNVGLGTTSPGFPLSFASTTGDKLSLYDSGGGNYFGFGIAPSQLQIHTDNSASDVVFGYGGQSSGFTETMRIKGNGNVGIGTATPGAKLDVNGGLSINGNLAMGFNQEITVKNSSGNPEDFLWPRYSDNVTYLIYGSGGFNIRNNAGATTMFMAANGNVGIGTTTFMAANGNVGIGTTTPTKGSLEIDTENGVQPGYNPAGILNSSGGHAAYAGPGGNVSIWATGWIFADTFVGYSDERIKNIQGQSDSAADLKTLLGIKVTDYTYKDTIAKGNRPHKKVVAQQVEQVYPQAVSQSTDVVPDIYRNATVKDGWVQLATDLKVGDRVKLIGEKEKGTYAVLEVRDGAFRTEFKPATQQLFVYGREVKDFRSVDYEAIAMLNVSATQELARRVQKLEAREAHLAELEQNASQVAALEVEVADLKKMVAQLAAASRTAKPTALLTPAESPSAAVASLQTDPATVRLHR